MQEINIYNRVVVETGTELLSQFKNSHWEKRGTSFHEILDSVNNFCDGIQLRLKNDFFEICDKESSILLKFLDNLIDLWNKKEF
jgi:hypothetical protein